MIFKSWDCVKSTLERNTTLAYPRLSEYSLLQLYPYNFNILIINNGNNVTFGSLLYSLLDQLSMVSIYYYIFCFPCSS